MFHSNDAFIAWMIEGFDGSVYPLSRCYIEWIGSRDPFPAMWLAERVVYKHKPPSAFVGLVLKKFVLADFVGKWFRKKYFHWALSLLTSFLWLFVQIMKLLHWKEKKNGKRPIPSDFCLLHCMFYIPLLFQIKHDATETEKWFCQLSLALPGSTWLKTSFLFLVVNW